MTTTIKMTGIFYAYDANSLEELFEFDMQVFLRKHLVDSLFSLVNIQLDKKTYNAEGINFNEKGVYTEVTLTLVSPIENDTVLRNFYHDWLEQSYWVGNLLYLEVL